MKGFVIFCGVYILFTAVFNGLGIERDLNMIAMLLVGSAFIGKGFGMENIVVMEVYDGDESNEGGEK